MAAMQQALFDSDVDARRGLATALKGQLLKWIGNKQRMAQEIISYFPADFDTYYEPFLGSGGVMATLAPERGIGSDVFAPLMEIWSTLKEDPDTLKEWYRDRWVRYQNGDRVEEYEKIKASYNSCANGADFLFLSRSCYAGVVRFRKTDGYMSTPCGPHNPISPESFASRVDIWGERLLGANFRCCDYKEAFANAGSDDLIYCDPPYSHSQAILYGAQDFQLEDLFLLIQEAKKRGVRVALSIDGTKKSGSVDCALPIPDGLFEHEIHVHVGRSMLKRLQMEGATLEGEVVADRLLLTY